MVIQQTDYKSDQKHITARHPGKLLSLRAVWFVGEAGWERWQSTGLGWLPSFPAGEVVSGLPYLATVCVHGTLANYEGWLLAIDDATEMALVLVFDDVLKGGCVRQQWVAYRFIEVVNV